MITQAFLITTFATLFVVIDPPGLLLAELSMQFDIDGVRGTGLIG